MSYVGIRKLLALAIFIAGFVVFMAGNEALGIIMPLLAMVIFLGFLGTLGAIFEMIGGIVKALLPK